MDKTENDYYRIRTEESEEGKKLFEAYVYLHGCHVVSPRFFSEADAVTFSLGVIGKKAISLNLIDCLYPESD
jgi:hypothetical protein